MLGLAFENEEAVRLHSNECGLDPRDAILGEWRRENPIRGCNS